MEDTRAIGVGRGLLGVVAGVIGWFAVATLANLALRLGWSAYAGVEKSMAFTPAMMAARLALGGVSSLGAGFAAAWIGRGDRRVVAIVATVLLLVFVPAHYMLWDRFPSWYHVAFLASLVVLILAGGQLASQSLAPGHARESSGDPR